MSGVRTRAPATSANLGPGFDCAAVALDLWNEVEVTEGGGEPPDPAHIGIRAFGLVASPEGLSFTWTDRIPRARGLGSSAATIALGLVAATKWSGQELGPEDLLARGSPLEGHSDNLAACLAGGVCLTWDGRIARVADSLPLTPVAVIPAHRVRTAEARNALPVQVAHADASFTVARAALLGAGLARGDARLLAPAFEDRLHEPYRPSPLLDSIRRDLPSGAVGATLSGSGPTVIVWAEDAGAAAAELEGRFPGETVAALPVSAEGVH
ncbi:MAG TPA: homoserine kinase [Gaiellaceae bacterium]|nr:homoserine kinase [Gaiellaceae bacterium]